MTGAIFSPVDHRAIMLAPGEERRQDHADGAGALASRGDASAQAAGGLWQK